MNSITTFETSAALIAAGFPVPTPVAGQVWYSPARVEFIVYSNIIQSGMADIISCDTGSRFYDRFLNDGVMIPAFTVTDILRELGDCFNLTWQGSAFAENAHKWIVTDLLSEYEDEYAHINPAEAAAIAWLSKNKKI